MIRSPRSRRARLGVASAISVVCCRARLRRTPGSRHDRRRAHSRRRAAIARRRRGGGRARARGSHAVARTRRPDPVRRPPRPHDLLGRRVHDGPADPAGRRRAPDRRRLRLRALLLGPRLLEHQRPRREHHAAALAGDAGRDPPVQRDRRRPAESRPGVVPRLGVDPDRPDARDALRPQERRVARHRGRQGAASADPLGRVRGAGDAPERSARCSVCCSRSPTSRTATTT